MRQVNDYDSVAYEHLAGRNLCDAKCSCWNGIHLVIESSMQQFTIQSEFHSYGTAENKDLILTAVPEEGSVPWC